MESYIIFLTPFTLRQVKLPEGLATIGGAAFYGAGPISLAIPSTVRETEAEAFRLVKFNGDVRIPEGMTHLSQSVFYEATVDGDIYLPSTLASVGSLCLSIKRVKNHAQNFYFNRMTPPKLESDNIYTAFGDVKLPSNWTLYVPVGAKAAFVADELDWGRFSNIIETPDLDGGQGDGINATVLDNAATGDGRIFTLDGRYAGKSLDALQSGIYVVNGKKIVKQ